MTETITPSEWCGTVKAPPSKSHLQRAIAIAALAEGRSIIEGYAPSADVDAAIAAVRALGAEVEVDGPTLRIARGQMLRHTATLHCGESGLAARMFGPVASLSPCGINVTGEGTIISRPFGMVQDALSQLGKTVHLTDGSLPMTLSGKMRSGGVEIDGSESSQLLTGLLIALPNLPGQSIIRVTGLKSRPYIQLTVETLAQFGVEVRNEDFQRFVIPGGQVPRAGRIKVEGDWSGAAFLLVGGAIGGEVSVNGLKTGSPQADRAILEVLGQVGTEVKSDDQGIKVRRSALRPFLFDATDCPDLFPPLAALAVCCEGRSIIKGVGRLRHKESDRAHSITSVLQSFGVPVDLVGDEMHITGALPTGCTVSSFHDHRIAMMAAVIGSRARGGTSITDAKAVNKSYPEFFRDMASLTRPRA